MEIVSLDSNAGSHFKVRKLIPILARLRRCVADNLPDVFSLFQSIANFTTALASLGSGLPYDRSRTARLWSLTVL